MTYEYDDDAYPEDRREAFYWGGDIPDQEEEDDIPSDGRYDHDVQHARGALPAGGPYSYSEHFPASVLSGEVPF